MAGIWALVWILQAPACRADAFTGDAHPVGVAVWCSLCLVPARAVLQRAVFAVPQVLAVALLLRPVPTAMGLVAIRNDVVYHRIRLLILLGIWLCGSRDSAEIAGAIIPTLLAAPTPFSFSLSLLLRLLLAR